MQTIRKVNKIQAKVLVAQGRSVFLRPDKRKGYHTNGMLNLGTPINHAQNFDAQVKEFEANMPSGNRRAAYVTQD